MFVLTISFKNGRTFVLFETEPGWVDVVNAIGVNLPDVAPFEKWAPEVISNRGLLTLYSGYQDSEN